jgi:hypothetical protein
LPEGLVDHLLDWVAMFGQIREHVDLIGAQVLERFDPERQLGSGLVNIHKDFQGSIQLSLEDPIGVVSIQRLRLSASQ